MLYLIKVDPTLSISGEAADAKIVGDRLKKIEETEENLKKSVSDGKSLVASAITEKGVETATDATFQTMHDNILNIKSGGSGSYVIADNSLDNPPLVSKDMFMIKDSMIECSAYLEEVTQ